MKVVLVDEDDVVVARSIPSKGQQILQGYGNRQKDGHTNGETRTNTVG